MGVRLRADAAGRSRMIRIVLAFCTILVLTSVSSAHDIFVGTIDPVEHQQCCNGVGTPPDCKIVPPEMAGVVQETDGGYRVTLTITQARYWDQTTVRAIDEVVPYERVQGGLSRGFAICVHSNKIWCFFGPSNT